MIEKLLEKLETINWIELKGSTGRNAGDIPSIFRDILSNNLETRNDAHLKLLLALNGDYLVGTASLIVIPFLIELLSMEGIPDKDKILFFLDDILIYPVPQIADEEKTISRFRNRDIRIKIAEEVWKGIDVYIDLLENDGELIQDSAAFLLFESKRFPQEHENRLKILYEDLKLRTSNPELLQEFPKWDKIWLESMADSED